MQVSCARMRVDGLPQLPRRFVPVHRLDEHRIECAVCKHCACPKITTPRARKKSRVACRRIRSQRFCHDKPIETGHAQVTQNRVWNILRREKHASQSALRSIHGKPVCLEGDLGVVEEIGIVVDDQPASFALSDIPFPPRLTLLTLLTLIETTTARWSLAPTSHCVEPTWCMRNVQIVKNDQSCVCRGFPCFRVFHWVKPLGFAASTGRTRIRAPGERT